MNRREGAILLSLLLIVAAIFCTGISWGLPSRKVDPFLFGDHPVWTGAQIMRLAGDRADAVADENRGADVDRNPIARSSSLIVLNETDQQRAEIVRRYRLFTYQPDEMITMMALSGMKPGRRDFDPKLYQYGGLWIYPVGALIKLFAKPQAAVTYYLDHPEEFARFYLIARMYVVAWGLIGAMAIYSVMRRVGLVASVCAVLCYALLPVVVNMAHEAKPHLPGAVLVLLAAICATKYVETGLQKWWVLAAVACGMAAGMVLSAAVAFIILPMMTLLRAESTRQRLIVLISSLVIAVDVYFISNPYVLIHLLGSRAVLLSNLRNSQAMYRSPMSVGGVWNAIRLIGDGVTPLILVVALGVIVQQTRKRKRLATITLLLGIVCCVVLIQFVALATGKPGEYARFALVPDIALMLVAIAGLSRYRIALIAITLVTAVYGASYLWQFERDAIDPTTRLIAANRLRQLSDGGARTLAIVAEPAPYCLPPVDLFKWKIELLPVGQFESSDADVTIRTTESAAKAGELWIRPRLLRTPISWAGKSFQVLHRQEQAR